MRSISLSLFAAFSISAQAEILLEHHFQGLATTPLNLVAPDNNAIRPGTWNAGSIIAANGEVTDLTNTDQGAVFDLGSSWKFEPASTYRVTLNFTRLDNAVLFAGFRTANPSGAVQAQTQGTSFALRIREISGSDNVGLFQWPGGTFTQANELNYDVHSDASFTLEIATHNLTDAVVSVGSAQATVDLSTNLFRYFFIGYEDPTPVSPASDAKFNSVTLEGPLPPPLPPLSLLVRNTATGENLLSWPSSTNATYTLQSSPDLHTWTTVNDSDTTPFVGTGGDLQYMDTQASPRYFYRLIRP